MGRKLTTQIALHFVSFCTWRAARPQRQPPSSGAVRGCGFSDDCGPANDDGGHHRSQVKGLDAALSRGRAAAHCQRGELQNHSQTTDMHSRGDGGRN